MKVLPKVQASYTAYNMGTFTGTVAESWSSVVATPDRTRRDNACL